MGLFDSILLFFNQEIGENFRDLYDNYREGLEAFCSSVQFVNNRGSKTLSDLSFGDKKFLCTYETTIKEEHRQIILRKKRKNDYLALEKLSNEYPHAFVQICDECLGGIIFNDKIKMPNKPKTCSPKTSKSKQQEQIERTYSNKEILAVSAFFKLSDRERYYNKQYNSLTLFNNKYAKNPESVWELLYDDVLKILEKKDFFKSTEDSIILLLEEQEQSERFNELVLKDTIREKHYKEFLTKSGKGIHDYKFILSHLKDLDEYIHTIYSSLLVSIYKQFPFGIQYIKSIHGHMDFTSLEFSIYCVENKKLIEEYDTLLRRYHLIKEENLYALTAYVRSRWGCDLSYIDDIRMKKDIVDHGTSFLKKYFQDNLSYQNYCELIGEQRAYCNKCRSSARSILKPFGYFNFEITKPVSVNLDGLENKKYHVVQIFRKKVCEDESLDYTLFPDNEHNRSFKPALLEMTGHIKKSTFDLIISYVANIKKIYGDCFVLLGDSGTKSKDFISFHFKYLCENFNKLGIYYSSELISTKAYFLYNHVVIIDIISNAKRIKEQCKLLFEEFPNNNLHICCISLLNELTKVQMTKVLDNAKREQEKKIEEEKERIKLEQIRIKKKQEETEFLTHCVESWDRPSRSSLPCFSMYYYYPTTCEWEADDLEWDIRNMIWNFKANSKNESNVDKIISYHKDAVKQIVKDMSFCLRHFFGNSLSNLTLVCIPASTKTINERRYKDFSNLICSELKMNDAYQYINIKEDGEAKHTGGTKNVELSIDNEFFTDKLVLLFDDVITSGSSMERMKCMLENSGAKVIGGFSIGRTVHTRRTPNPIQMLN